MSNDVPLLTAEMAVLLRTYDPSVARPQLLAIADGRAVVVPRMTEAEARERFQASYPKLDMRPYPDQRLAPGAYLCNETSHRWWGYLAALRDIGVIRD